jgi:hypothetical protein
MEWTIAGTTKPIAESASSVAPIPADVRLKVAG